MPISQNFSEIRFYDMVRDAYDRPVANESGRPAPGDIASALDEKLNAPEQELPPVQSERRFVFKPFEASEEKYAFVSYAHDDAALVYHVIKELYEAGWNLWYDEGIRITERYLPEIALHVRDCEVFLLFITETALRRPFVMNFELEYALSLGKRVVPVMLDMVKRIPPQIENLARVAPDETLRRALSAAELKNYGEREAVPPKDKKREEYDLEQLTPMKDYTYRPMGDGLCMTKYTGNETHVVVPESHCGLPVRGLERTFYGRKGIEEIRLPETVYYIGWETFYLRKGTVIIYPHAQGQYSMQKDPERYIILPHSFTMLLLIMGFVLALCILADFYIWLGVLYSFIISIGLLSIVWIISTAVAILFQNWKKEKTAATHIFTDSDMQETLSQPAALACYTCNSEVFDAVNAIRAEGYTIARFTDTSEVLTQYENIKMLVAFLNPKFFESNRLVQKLNDAVSNDIKILPVYYSMQPDDLPHEFASTVGMYQGVKFGDAEASYLMKRVLKTNGCWRNIALDFTYSIRAGKVEVKDYIGDNIIGKSTVICIPSHLFDSKHIISRFNRAVFSSLRDKVVGEIITKQSSIYELFIPETIEEIDVPISDYFAMASREFIYVHPDNRRYYCSDGVVYDRKKEAVLYCPRENKCKKICLERVKRIGVEAFFYNNNLVEIVIPVGVETIESGAFLHCHALSDAFIPESVMIIRDNSFDAQQGILRPNLTIHTPAGSYAERYAKKHNIPCKTYTPEEYDRLAAEQARLTEKSIAESIGAS